MKIDCTEFMYICERSTRKFEPVDLVNEKFNDYLAEMKVKLIMWKLFRSVECPDFDPKVNW